MPCRVGAVQETAGAGMVGREALVGREAMEEASVDAEAEKMEAMAEEVAYIPLETQNWEVSFVQTSGSSHVELGEWALEVGVAHRRTG